MNTAYLLIVIIGSGAQSFEFPNQKDCVLMKDFAISEIANKPDLPPSAVQCFRSLGGRKQES